MLNIHTYGRKPTMIISPCNQYLVWNRVAHRWDDLPAQYHHLARPYGGGL